LSPVGGEEKHSDGKKRKSTRTGGGLQELGESASGRKERVPATLEGTLLKKGIPWKGRPVLFERWGGGEVTCPTL